MNSKNEGIFALITLILFLLLIAFCVTIIAKAEETETEEPEKQTEAIILSDHFFKSGLPNHYQILECQIVGIDADAFCSDEPLSAEITFTYNIDSLELVILSDGYNMINGHFRRLDSFTIEVSFPYDRIENFDNNFYLFMLFVGVT